MKRLLVVGNPDVVHVGAHFVAAARTLGLAVECADTRAAFDGPGWRRRADWWLRGHRPVRLESFSANVLDRVRAFGPDLVLATGLAPLDAATVAAITGDGVPCANFLTDDPWNPAHRAPWFDEALTSYDTVFTPRRANVADLRALGGPAVHYLPFAYNPDVHYPVARRPENEGRFASDVMIAGGADADRVELMRPLMTGSLDVALYGGYWEKHALTQPRARGHVDPEGLRLAVAHAGVCLGLVRRANRDGHAMRTYEVAAMGGCMLVEDTEDHRGLFGADGDCVSYFESPTDLPEKVAGLLAGPDDRRRLAEAARRRVTDGGHTYVSRLTEILKRMADRANGVAGVQREVAG